VNTENESGAAVRTPDQRASTSFRSATIVSVRLARSPRAVTDAGSMTRTAIAYVTRLAAPSSVALTCQ